MRRTLTTFSFLVLLPAAAAFGQTLGAVLTASQEVPPTTSPGFGNFTGTFDSTRTNLTITLTVANLGAPITGAHIHEKDPGSQTGAVKINFVSSSFSGGRLTGSFPVPSTDPTLFTRILANPSNFYVNVHTTQFPNGAIRGELSLMNSVINYAADLKGSNETPPNSSTATGSAFVTIDTINNTIAWDIVTQGIASPSAAHIHGPGGLPGIAKGVLIGFATSGSAFTNGRTSGSASIASLDAGTLNLLFTDPNQFYVNVHSSAFPGGEIRGQLVAANEVDVPVAGLVGSFVTDVRVFNPSFDTTIDGMVEFFPQGTTANTTAANAIAINLPPRGTAVLNNVNGSSLLNSGTGIGGVRVSSAEAINVTSKIFSDQRAAGKGTFGQFLPGLPRGEALRRGVLPHLENDANFRTNVGFFNPNTTAVTVRLELRDETGAVVASSVQTFQPLSHQQNRISDYFPGVDFTNRTNLTLSFDASAPIDVYAAVNDNISTDSFVVIAQPDVGVAANQ